MQADTTFRHYEFTSSDSPIEEFSHDALNRGRFCISLANTISEWRRDSGLVIGLHGAWGSGKTSVKNLVVELLNRRDPPVATIEFNPWSWSGEDKLSNAFFEEIGNSLESSDVTGSGTLAVTWRKYAAHLTLGSSALRGLSLASEAAGVPWAPLLLRGLADAASRSADITAQAATAKAANEDAPEPLIKIQNSLHDELSRLDRPILVVLDDIDRLSKEEIAILFRLVKANANFPNIVFLTLYDRAIVENALNSYTGSSGAEFLKKIVQVTFDLPSVDRTDLDAVFTDQLRSVQLHLPKTSSFDNDRFQHVYNEGLAPYFSTLRDIKRFFSSFAFHVELFFNQLEFEANLLDLLCLESLRVFEPNVYRHLHTHPSCVFGPNSIFGSKQEQRSEHEASVSDLLNQARLHEATHEILAFVFPQIGWLRDNVGRGVGFEERWLQERRVCHPDQFDRYFQLTVESKETSAAFMNQLQAATSDRESFCKLLLSLGDKSRIAKALRRFEGMVEYVPAGSELEVVHGLFKAGEKMVSQEVGINPSDPRFTCWRIIRSLFLRIEDPATRSAAFCEQLEATPYLWLPCQITALEEPDENMSLSPQKDLLVKEDVNRATTICAKKIASAAGANAIVGREMMFYLYRWRDWGGEEAARQWVEKYTAAPDCAIHFLRAITREVSSVSASPAGIRLDTDLRGLKDFIPPEVFRPKIAHFLDAPDGPNDQASEDDQQLRRLWKKAFEQLDKQS